MDKVLETVFLRELDGQCNFARLALAGIRDFQSRMFSIPPADIDMEGRRFWAGVQSLLASVANISKIFYPVRRNKKGTTGGEPTRGKHLRKFIGEAIAKPFDDTSRSVRNCYEHFDEKIERDWWAQGGRQMVDYNIMPVGSFDSKNCFRNLDPHTDALIFMTETFPLKPMEAAIIALQLRISALLQ